MIFILIYYNYKDFILCHLNFLFKIFLKILVMSSLNIFSSISKDTKTLEFQVSMIDSSNKLIKDNLVAYDIITTFIDIDDFIDIVYNHKSIISNKDEYKSKVNHDLFKKLNGMEEIDVMTPEKIDICREKLKEIVDTILI